MIKRLILLFIIFFILLFVSGCIGLRIQTDVDYPDELFSRSLKKIKKIHRKDPYRKGEVEGIHLLVYDGKERKLISFSVPSKFAELVLENKKSLNYSELNQYSFELDDFDLNDLGDLVRIGPGLLVNIEDLSENTHVLIWFD